MRYSKVIEEYCDAHGITVPSGFHRHPASRFAIVLRGDPPRLVALTWFKKEDVVYYLRNLAEKEILAILDFKERVELEYEGGSRLKRGRTME